VQRGWLDLSEVKTLRVSPAEAAALKLLPGDVLMNEGGDRDKLGRGWIWEGQIEDCIHQNHVFRLRPRSHQLRPRYISYYANEFGQEYFDREGKQTTNLASISLSRLSDLPIPIAGPDEMVAVLASIEVAFEVIKTVQDEGVRALALASRTGEAVVAKALRGELSGGNPEQEAP
jgi:type I restriction enzyme S subunit